MPAFDLRYIKIGKYKNTSGTISYSDVTSVGDAMDVNLQFKYAEGRLYAEGVLAEYLKLITGGTISIAVKYIPAEAQKAMFGAKDSSITVAGITPAATGLAYTGADEPSAVGCAFYAPDMIDGALKYTCVFIRRVIFGLPAMAYKTKGDSLTFQTPTTSGEFLPDHSNTQNLIDVVTVDSVESAKKWVDGALGVTAGGSQA